MAMAYGDVREMLVCFNLLRCKEAQEQQLARVRRQCLVSEIAE